MMLLKSAFSIKLKDIVVIGLILAVCVYGYRAWQKSDSMPDVSYYLLDGGIVNPSDLKGKFVIVSFWSVNCSVCVKELATLTSFYNNHRGKGVEIILVAVPHDPPEELSSFIRRELLSLKVAHDVNGRIVQAWGGISYTPTVFFVNYQGKVMDRVVGEVTMAELERLYQQGRNPQLP